ncbi:MAG: DUF5686 family protein, partial [Thermonemataceae bacterium]|nr:DUF5686 family protein [Thermonemataceae bacterium]
MIKFSYKTYLIFLFLFGQINYLLAQEITITGKLLDAKTKEAIIGANIYLQKNTKIGTISETDGSFKLTFLYQKDSLVFNYTGYQIKKLAFKKQAQQYLEVLIEEDVGEIEAISVTPGENPAWEIIRQVVKNKKKNDKRRLEYYECDNYNRIEGYVTDNQAALSKLKVVKDMAKASQKYEALRNTKGQILVPVLVSESFSAFYYMRNPLKEKEEVKATNLTGLGLEDAKGIGQIFAGARLNEYNFYRNQLNILDKYFTSPIADGWRIKYDYDLMDSVWVGKDFCYVLNIVPKNPQDLVFQGKMWITKEGYALKKIEVMMSPKANINFISNVKIKQELERYEQGAWLPVQEDFQVEISEFSKLIPDIFFRIHSIHQNYTFEQKKPKDFFDIQTESQSEEIKDSNYWQKFREKDSTLLNQVNIYQLIDSIKTIPSVKRYTTILTVLSTGYYETKAGIDYGHYARFYSWNDVEGHRPAFGFKTNHYFNKNFIWRVRGGYGTMDKKFKYHTEVTQVVSRKYFTQIGIRRTEEIEPVIQLNQLDDLPEFFVASNRFFTLSERKPFMKKETAFWAERDLNASFKQKITFQHRILLPVHNFAYKYPDSTNYQTDITTSELILKTTWLKGGNRVRLLDNTEMNLGGSTKPKLSLTGVFGFSGLGGSQFQYQKLFLDISQRNARLLGLGHANYALTAGYIFGELPFPLLQIHLGNNTPILIERAFNQMNAFEFVSDHFVAFHYTHDL